VSTDDEDMDLKRVYSIMKDICKLKREFSRRFQAFQTLRNLNRFNRGFSQMFKPSFSFTS